MQIANQKQSTTHTETQAARKQPEAAKKQHGLARKTGTRAGTGRRKLGEAEAGADMDTSLMLCTSL
jgi:hypothetical protein